jgi:dihydropteroate synthase
LYFQPIVRHRRDLRGNPPPLAGGWFNFELVDVFDRNGAAERVSWTEIPSYVFDLLTRPRPDLLGMTLDRPRVMGILNVTPDSFSDGGRFTGFAAALAHVRAMVAAGTDIIDIGGESTRPGAETVADGEEISRTGPVIAAIAGQGLPISIDTRKASVARAALSAGADMVNDVSGLSFDPAMTDLIREQGVPVCIMHAQGDPKSMQHAPTYDNVLLDVYDWLEARITDAVSAGMKRDQIIVDPGIGFGKTLEHNLALLRGLPLFHGLGCPILLGASRKRFIGVIGGAPEAADRLPGSLAVALHAAAQGVQILRVHDAGETVQALALWRAMEGV